jgi:hypothetical protein
MKYTEFLASALKESKEGLKAGHAIASAGLGCMDARDFAINMTLARNVDLILRDAQRRIEEEVRKAESVEQHGWYPLLKESQGQSVSSPDA